MRRKLDAIGRATVVGVLLLGVAACAPRAYGEGGASEAALRLERQAYLERWRQLERAGVPGLERFARLVQEIVDARAAAPGGDETAAKRRLLDDLVDLFVDPAYAREKALVMSSPPLLRSGTIDDSAADRASFAPAFRAGEGRYRHFAMNAAAAFVAPDAWVDLAARLRGGDLAPSPEASADSAADVATNDIGRAFARLLRERPLAQLGDGETVRAWIVDRFGGDGAR